MPELELDELWSYVGRKDHKVWIWLAQERMTRRIVGCAFGDRSEVTAQRLFDSLPLFYQQEGFFYTDQWEAYRILPYNQHEWGGKETNHVERFNGTLRQSCANLVRRTLSFSRNDAMHQIRILNFIHHYNLTRSP